MSESTRDTSPAPIVEAQIITGQGTCERCRDAVFETYAGPMVRHQCFLTSPAPATVTDEERRALLKKALGEAMIGSRGGLTWEGGYARGWDDFKAAVGPALARLAELEQRAKAKARVGFPAEKHCAEYILTGSDAEKGKT